MHILYVNHDLQESRQLRNELAAATPQVVLDVVGDCEEAAVTLEQSPERTYDLVLVDIGQAPHEGLNLLTRIRRHGWPLVIVIVPETGDQEIVVTALRAGADDYLVKSHGYARNLLTNLQGILRRFRSHWARRSHALRVLYAEDDVVDAEKIRKHLEKHAPNIQLHTVSTMTGVFEHLCRCKPHACYDTLLLNYRFLDTGDAGDLRKLIQVHEPDVPVILVVGPDSEMIALQSLKFGIMDYVIRDADYLDRLPLVLENVVQRKQLIHQHAVLLENQERFNLISEHIPVALWTVDADLRLTSALGGVVFDLGPQCDPIGMTLFEYFQTDDAEHGLIAVHINVLKGETVGSEIEWGGRFYTLHVKPLRNAIDEIVGCVGSVFDVTERKLAEQAFRLAQFSVQHASDSIFWLTPGGQLVFANDAATLTLGYSGEELLGMTIFDIDPDLTPEDWVEYWQQLKQCGKLTAEFRHRAKNGIIFPVKVRANYLVQGGKEYAFEFCHDLSEHQQARKEKEGLQSQLFQAQKMETIGRLTAGIAHDFNNLLTVINGYAEITKRQLGEDQHILKYVDAISDAGLRAAALVRQLLVFSHKTTTHPQELDLNAVISETSHMIRRIVGEDIKLKTSLAPDIWPIMMDPIHVEQIILNLVVNARDAMPEGGRLSIQTENAELDEDYAAHHVGAKPGKYICLRISDTGVGMSCAVKDRMFEPFFSTKEEGKGTGLGLTTVYALVQRYTGFIWVESAEDLGSTFDIFLPRAEDVPQQTSTSSHPADLKRGDETILILEDEPTMLELTAQVLRDQGYRVLEAENGQQALALAENESAPIHMLLADVVIPDTSGKEAADELLANNPELKVLYMSGYSDEIITRRGVSKAKAHFLQKPFNTTTLLDRVRRILDSDL